MCNYSANHCLGEQGSIYSGESHHQNSDIIFQSHVLKSASCYSFLDNGCCFVWSFIQFFHTNLGIMF